MDALVESVIVAAFIAGPLAVLAVLAAIGDRMADRHYHRTHEPVETPHDFDDWRDPVIPFFRSRFESHTRSRLAVAATCGADPEKKMAPARVKSPDAMTTHGGRSNEQYR